MWRTQSSFDTIPELRSRTVHKMGDKHKHSPGVHGRRRRHSNQQCIFGSDVGLLLFWGFFGIKNCILKYIYFCVIYQDTLTCVLQRCSFDAKVQKICWTNYSLISRDFCMISLGNPIHGPLFLEVKN